VLAPKDFPKKDCGQNATQTSLTVKDERLAELVSPIHYNNPLNESRDY